jgi:hypothetical protein
MKNAKHSILDWQPVSSLIIKTRFKSKARNISIIHIYAPTEDAELDTKEAFYSQLTATIKDIKKKDVAIVMGDLNAKVGSKNLHLPHIMDMRGLGVKNENGELFIDFCTQNGLVMGGTMFIHKRIHKITWKSPDGVTKNQIDHISISNKWKKSLLNVRSYRGADIDSDHHLVIAEVQMKVARVKHNHDSKTRKMDYQKLHDQDTKDHFTLEHRNRFALLENGFIRQEVDTDVNTKWKQIKELYTDTAQEVLGYKIKTKKTWMLHNSWELIKERKKLKQIINQANTMDREEILKI